MPKREEPQLTVQKFKPLLDFDEITKGTKIFKKNDQKKVHWEYTSYIITGVSDTHLLCKDAEGKKFAFAWEDLPQYNFTVIV